MLLHIALPLLFGATFLSNSEGLSDQGDCSTSRTVRAQAPRDPNADPAGGDWLINPNRTIWAGWLVQDGVTRWQPGARLKTYWVRPQGTQLVISGRRLDGPADPIDAWIPCCYPTGFQIVGLRFPTAGCWEVHAKAGGEELWFVTRVKPASPSNAPTCAVTQPTPGESPRDDFAAYGLSGGNWFVNEDRSIWMRQTHWQAGGSGNKVLWIRPRGTELVISGRRLDAPAPPLQADTPFHPPGLQKLAALPRMGPMPTGLRFPAEGCWEVSARAADRELTIVVHVDPSRFDPKRPQDSR